MTAQVLACTASGSLITKVALLILASGLVYTVVKGAASAAVLVFSFMVT
jgi:hypothetical protein